MKLRNLIYTALTALALSALAGCSSETELLQEAPDPVLPEGMTRIDFDIKGVKTGTSYATPTVGLEEYERAVKDVTAYLFKMGSGQTVPADGDKVVCAVAATSIANGKGSVVMPPSVKAGTYSVVFVANKGCFATALNDVASNVTTYGELNAIETLANTAIMAGLSADPAVNKGVPMRALTNAVVIPASGGKVEIRADFSRPLSRFDIDNEAVHSFSVTSVALVNGRSTSPLNAPGNTAGAENKVAGVVVPNIDYLKLLSDVNAKLDPPVDGKVTQLRPAFYAAPGLATDATSLKVTGELRIGLDKVERTYVVPLKNKADGSDITIGANKRYRVTLKMTAGEDIIADIEMDLGNWGDDDEAITDVPKDVYYIVAPTSLSAGASYTESTKTFEVIAGTPTFRFEMLSTLPDAVITQDGTVVKAIAPVAPGTRAMDPNHTVYEVTVAGVAGATGTFTFTKDAKTFVFKVKLLDDTIYPVSGVTEAPILIGDIYWAPVNVGALSSTIPGEMFQFGRMSSWLSGAEINSNLVRIPLLPSEADAAQYKDKYILQGKDWWSYRTTEEKTILSKTFDRWKGVSQDEATHPCPVGWRLPTLKEAQVLLNGGRHTAVQVTPGVWKVTVQGVTFTSKEYYSYTERSVPGTSRYWLSGDGIAVDGHLMKLINCTHSNLSIGSNYLSATTDACYIRCVKDRLVPAP